MEHLVPGPGTRPRDRQTAAPQPASPVPRRPAPDATSLSDFLGGRALAWLGGIATLIGIVLLLGLAISHEWIGPAVRVILAGAGSAALLADGAWLHAHRGRTEAAVAMVGAATAGAFATLVVAGDLYRLIPAAAAVVGAMLVGAVATALAIRWAGRAIAVLGLIALLAIPLRGGCVAPMPWLASRLSGALAVVDGGRLIAAARACSGRSALPARFAPRYAGQPRSTRSTWHWHSSSLNATIVGVAGRLAFGTTGGALWLAGIAITHATLGLWRRPRIAIAHATLGLWRRPRIAIHPTLRRLLIAIAVALADVALAVAVHGIALTAAWGATSIGFAWLVRRADRHPGQGDETWLTAALGAHVGLLLVRTLIALPPVSSRPDRRSCRSPRWRSWQRPASAQRVSARRVATGGRCLTRSGCWR